MRVSLVQFRPELFQIKSNVEKALKMVNDTEEDLIVLPEMAFTGYAYTDKEEVEKTSETAGEDSAYSINTVRDFAVKKNKNIVFGFNEKYNNEYYNSSIFIKSDGSYSIYRKIHLFNREKLFFTPGENGFFVEDFKGYKVGMAICFDWIFPESFRTLNVLGAELIVHPSNLVLPYCQEANKIRSLENRLFIATSNRWGVEKNKNIEYEFTGMSQITDPKGNIIERYEKKGDIVKTFNLNLLESRDKNINKFNNILKDRRKEFYR
ncbi:nitrilase-related carbon-nitrogen hydrolase [Geotoga petraea]|uniref:Nitrilase n=1 Tax=Geotoga petraea TaxID=28234 RepID=A0A4Z0W608_9BACT|nr:nitrilase-related carbon-nitrogen hydrolase [Geotoga petraea]TGG89270.1 nitrilase [Geotoga petraea]